MDALVAAMPSEMQIISARMQAGYRAIPLSWPRNAQRPSPSHRLRDTLAQPVTRPPPRAISAAHLRAPNRHFDQNIKGDPWHHPCSWAISSGDDTDDDFPKDVFSGWPKEPPYLLTLDVKKMNFGGTGDPILPGFSEIGGVCRAGSCQRPRIAAARRLL